MIIEKTGVKLNILVRNSSDIKNSELYEVLFYLKLGGCSEE